MTASMLRPTGSGPGGMTCGGAGRRRPWLSCIRKAQSETARRSHSCRPLEGFDDRAVIKAMGRTSNRTFVVYSKPRRRCEVGLRRYKR